MATRFLLHGDPARAGTPTTKKAYEPPPPFPEGVSKESRTISSYIPRVNGRIRAREVRVIVSATNQQLGVLNLQDAMRHARALGLDLVEVAPNAAPPVCRIVDFGKYRYEQAKQDKEKKHVTTKLKEVKFRVKIGEHDYMTKVRHAEQFLAKGNKVRVQLQFRGRENAHQELGFQLLERVKGDLDTMANVEMEARKMGRAINMVLSPLPEARRKRRWTKESEDIDDEELETAAVADVEPDEEE